MDPVLDHPCAPPPPPASASQSLQVDNSVRLATAMNCQSLLDFIIEKVKKNEDDVVNEKQTGKYLKDMLTSHGVYNPEQLSVEGLGLQPGSNKRFHRFDIFSKKYSTGGQGSVELLMLFLKFRNHIKGRYFGEMVKPLLMKHDEEESRVATEYKVPIFGTDRQVLFVAFPALCLCLQQLQWW